MPVLTLVVLELHRFNDLPYGLIAVRLGIRINDVEAQVVAALTHLSLTLNGDS